MSNVTLAIGGRNFTVACAEGEEGHVSDLGRMIAGKVTSMGDLSGQSETRMLLFAALLLADELHEATVRSDGGSPAQPGLSPASAARLDGIAGRLESLADLLEG